MFAKNGRTGGDFFQFENDKKFVLKINTSNFEKLFV
jgi:hypothetical protein